MKQIGVYVSVPVACFRVPRAREYFETFPCPPPATVYGMLLSMVGETNRRVHEGAEIAIAMLSVPSYSTVLRTLWRVKNKNEGLGQGNNRRPDFQELLTDLRFIAWVRRGVHESNEQSLAERLSEAFLQPSIVSRFGGLSLGESTHLVDEVKPYTQSTERGRVLMKDDDGDLSLPVWVDHVGADTRWAQYTLRETSLTPENISNSWTEILRPQR